MNGTFSSSLKENIQIDILEIKELNIDHLNIILNEYKEISIQTIIKEFGIGPFLDNYKEGGNVTTLHNAKVGKFSNVNIQAQFEKEYSHLVRKELYEKDFTKMRKEEFNNHDVIVDSYTDRELSKDGTTHRDHVVSAAEIHRNDSARLYMNDDERSTMAVAKENLAWTNSSLNQSKSDRDMKEWMDSKSSNDELKTNKERFGLDEKKTMEKYIEAKSHVKKNIDGKKKEYFIKNITGSGAKQGLQMGLKQVIGLFLYEFQSILFKEMRSYFKQFKQLNGWEVRLEEFKKRLEVVYRHMISKSKVLLKTFGDGFLSGFIGNVLTVFINTFVTTSKNITRFLSEGISSLWRAFLLLINPPQDMSISNIIKEITKIVTSVLVSTTGVIMTESFVIYLKTTIFSPFAEVIGGVLGGILTGIVIATLMYAIDNLGSILITLRDTFDTIRFGIKASSKEIEDKYQLIISKIDEEYELVLGQIFAQYQEYRKLAIISFDTSLETEVSLVASAELSNLLDISEENIMKTRKDVISFLNE